MKIHQLLSEHITNKMPSGVITIDRTGRITSYNPVSERIFEGNLAEDRRLSELVLESQILEVLISHCLDNGETFTRMEFHVSTKRDMDKRIGINLSPITNADAEIEGAICLLSDLTEIVELQNQIKLKENFAALGEMSAGIAHEFKNSIATIVGYAQMSTKETDVETLQSYAREIHKESQALSNMVTDFLNFARPVKASIYEVDLSELLRSVIADVRNLRPGDYDIGFHAVAEAVVFCDATLMRQTFLNLLINSVESFNGKGAISVRVGLSRDRGQVRVVIEDTGRGIPHEQLGKIFFPFFTTKAHGTGLGLSLVQKIVLAHNGKIDVQSSEGRGTRFTIHLPIKAR
jgi:PAS domain S-box-containing protein